MGNPLLIRATLLVLLSLRAAAAVALDLYVVTSDRLLSPADIREVYLGEKEFSGGMRVVPVDNLALQDTFLARVLSMNEQHYTALWVRKSFRDGLVPPQVKANDAEVIIFIRQTRGAIGYVSAPPRDKDIRVIGKF
jgi:hypothetical protein